MTRLGKFSPTFGRKVAIALFMGALLTPAVAVATSNHLRETIAVVVGTPGSWPAQSNRLRVQTPLWNNAVSGYSTLLYKTGTSSNEGIGVVGRDGWMFLGDIQNANFWQALGRRQYSEEELATWSDVVAQQQQWLATRDIPMLFVVGPAKWSVYEDKLPAWTEGRIGERVFDQVLEYDPSLPLVDLRGALTSARQTADTYSRLNSHWTGYGAYVGWQEIASAIDDVITVPGGVRVPELSDVTSIDGPNEFDSMMGVRVPNPWTVAQFSTALAPSVIQNADGSSSELAGSTSTGILDLPRTTTNPQAGNDLTALVLRDSMGTGLSTYLQSAFGTTVQVRHSIDVPADAPNIEALVDRVQPDIVIVEMAERHFNSGLPDGPVWQAANAYDRADATQQREWSSDGSTAGSISVAGSLDAGSVGLAWSPAGSGEQVLRLSLLSSGPGQLVVTTPDGDAQTLRVATDSNLLFATIPAGADSGEVALALAPGSPPVTLMSASVRPAGA